MTNTRRTAAAAAHTRTAGARARARAIGQAVATRDDNEGVLRSNDLIESTEELLAGYGMSRTDLAVRPEADAAADLVAYLVCELAIDTPAEPVAFARAFQALWIALGGDTSAVLGEVAVANGIPA